MAGQKFVGSATAEGFLSTCNDFGFGAADIGDESVWWQMRSQSLNQIDDRGYGCGKHDYVAALASFAGIGGSMVDRLNLLRESQNFRLVATDNFAGECFFFERQPK